MPRPKPSRKGDRDRKSAAAAAKTAPAKEQTKAAAAAAPAVPLETLEEERTKVLEQLLTVEQQVYRLESTYFKNADTLGNALIGYSGLLEHPPEPKRQRTHPVPEEERVFSGSSVSGSFADL